MNKDEQLWAILLKNIEWIKFSESKAGILITVYGVILTIIYTNATTTFESIEQSGFLILLCGLTITSSIISIFFAFKTINPILKNNNPTSLIYFGHIATKFTNHVDFTNEANLVFGDKAKQEEQISEQVYITSVIAWQKFKNVAQAIRYFVVSLGVTIVSVIYYLVTL